MTNGEERLVNRARVDFPRERYSSLGISSFVILFLLSSSASFAQTWKGWLEIPVPQQRPEPSEENILKGKTIYNFRCSPCHGIKGQAEGVVAKYLDPRPRDFGLANFKFRTSLFAELPTDDDLFRTITRGVPGTAMPSWEAALSAEDRWNVLYYVKTLADDDLFGDELFDPHRIEDGQRFILDIGTPPKKTAKLLEEGRKLFELEGAKCIECHGKKGRGDGPAAAEGNKQVTAKKDRIWPRNMTKSWRYKNGSDVEDIFRTLSAGLNGTPMPTNMGSLDKDNPAEDERKRWAIAYYVQSLLEEVDESKTILNVRYIDGALPDSPADAAWGDADELQFRLAGQATFRPRWQIPSVDFVKIRALYNDREIAFRIQYDDRSKSEVHLDKDIWDERPDSKQPPSASEPPVSAESDSPATAAPEQSTYPELDVKSFAAQQHKYRDAVAIQFPVKPGRGAQKPYFLYGNGHKPVHLLRWEADKGAVVEYNAKGYKKLAAQDEKDQSAQGSAAFNDGQWTIVIRRKLNADKNDAPLEPGAYVPFVVMAWDGGNGESGFQHSVSSWYNMILEVPTPASTYFHAIMWGVIAGIAELFLLFRVTRSPRRTAETTASVSASC